MKRRVERIEKSLSMNMKEELITKITINFVDRDENGNLVTIKTREIDLEK